LQVDSKDPCVYWLEGVHPNEVEWWHMEFPLGNQMVASDPKRIEGWWFSDNQNERIELHGEACELATDGAILDGSLSCNTCVTANCVQTPLWPIPVEERPCRFALDADEAVGRNLEWTNVYVADEALVQLVEPDAEVEQPWWRWTDTLELELGPSACADVASRKASLIVEVGCGGPLLC